MFHTKRNKEATGRNRKYVPGTTNDRYSRIVSPYTSKYSVLCSVIYIIMASNKEMVALQFACRDE